MRFADNVVFVNKIDKYNAKIGEYIPVVTKRKEALVNVTDIGTNTSVVDFGDIKQGGKVIRTIPLFVLPEFTHIEFEGKTYEAVTVRDLPNRRQSIIVQEVIVDG